MFGVSVARDGSEVNHIVQKMDGLTNSEKYVLNDILNGLSVKESAIYRCMSVQHIKNYRSRLYRKFGAKSDVQLVVMLLSGKRVDLNYYDFINPKPNYAI